MAANPRIRWHPGFVLSAMVFFLLVVAAPAQPAEELLYGRGLLWKVTKPGSAPSTILGTFHSADPRVTNLPPPVVQAFMAAESATFELIMTPQIGQRMGQSMFLSGGRQLDTILGPRLFQETAAAAARYGLQPRQVQKFKPWALMPVLSYPPPEQSRLGTGEAPLDELLQQQAARNGKALYQLETADEQIAVFDQMPEVDQVTLLRAVVQRNGGIAQEYETMVQRYLTRDVAAIHNEMAEQLAEAGPRFRDYFLKRFIYDRNARMVARMQAQLQIGKAFVAIGALHLPGERGVLNLLAQRGYRIERIH